MPSTPKHPKVLYVAAADYAAYHILLPQLMGLQAAGFDVTMACSAGPDLDRVEGYGIRVHPIAIPRRPASPKLLSAFWSLLRYIRRERFDVVHTHTPIASMITRPAAWLAGVPNVVYTAHGFYFHDRMPRWLFKSHVALERFLGLFTDYLVTVSGEDAQTAVDARIMPAQAVEWIPNAVDLERFQPADPAHLSRVERLREELGLAPGRPVIGIVGRLVREKGFFDFVEAARIVANQFPDARFVCVGAPLPSDRENPIEELRTRIAELGLEGRILLPGFRKDAVDFFGLMDVFALPSYREGMPLVVLEAMAMRKPCIVTNIRGCRELVTHGKHGLIVEPGDYQGLAKAMCELLGNPSEAQRMGLEGAKRVEAEYSQERYVSRYVDLYRRIQASQADEPK